jgi:heterodisulfide reductase subunit B
LGAESVAFPYRLECCGAYQTVTKKDVTAMRTYEIINSARRAGCEAIVTSCPLCAFNLDQRQKETGELYLEFTNMPVFYFTELLSIALGCGWDETWTKSHYVNPIPLLKEKELI